MWRHCGSGVLLLKQVRGALTYPICLCAGTVSAQIIKTRVESGICVCVFELSTDSWRDRDDLVVGQWLNGRTHVLHAGVSHWLYQERPLSESLNYIGNLDSDGAILARGTQTDEKCLDVLKQQTVYFCGISPLFGNTCQFIILNIMPSCNVLTYSVHNFTRTRFLSGKFVFLSFIRTLMKEGSTQWSLMYILHSLCTFWTKWMLRKEFMLLSYLSQSGLVTFLWHSSAMKRMGGGGQSSTNISMVSQKQAHLSAIAFTFL